MNINVIDKYKASVIEIKDELTRMDFAGIFRQKLYELIEGNKKNVVLDLSGIKYVNSIALGILIGGYMTMKNAGGELKLSNINEKVRTIMNVTKLNQIFSIYNNVDEAVSSFGQVAVPEKI